MTEEPRTGLLSHDVLIVQQINSFMANDFDILDTTGGVLGRVVGQDSFGGLFFAGPRRFLLVQSDGTPLLAFDDVMDIGFDTFEMSWPDGRRLATLRRRPALFSTSITVTAATGASMELVGDLGGLDYQVVSGGTVLGRVAREWAGMGAALLGHSRYAMTFAPGATEETRLLALGTAIALDLIRRKRRRRANN
ncbi:LURP-one-related/scramblase family protein [Propioniciclava flava]|uniref:Scramblase n=1 Tax=Propioniciclava flava TaxID=2072026 RepID=A0A4Q2EHT9_9ACTN|nr:hypothetical protein [Propioniciclava flava]RXW32132.1 hypothetical protein C1706_08820 [Propioniciclava flava]